ncbi:MAG: PBP1A family penicillin-binding protein [Deferrisomatales bacterium]|nr:PBP1A family penicillin-binding protein [Deferrisomatales bacterium]
MKTAWAVLGLVACGVLGFGAGAVAVLARGLPQVSALEDFSPPSSTRVFASDGTLLAEFATQRRTPVPLEKVPPDLVRAVLAIEDHRFFDHMGINVGRILKALAVDVLEGRLAEGGSTITQQLAKMLFLSPEKTLTRKVREAILALEIERRHTKDEVLAFYLNQIYLGNGAYGVAAAAEVYFRKPLGELSLAECALLAALPKAPSLYDPFRNPDRARARRDLVLGRLAVLGWASSAELEAARATALPAPAPSRPRTEAPYFVEAVRRRLLQHLELDLVYQGGLRVYTTLDSRLQRSADAALARTLEALDKRQPRRVPPAQGAVVALDPATGAVRALTGGRDWRESSFDRALQARRQPGSAYKPFVYMAALEAGYSQAATVLDAPARFPGASPREPWEPRNYDREFLGEMTLRKALSLSRNLPTIRLMADVGKHRVDDAARRLGLEGPLGEGLASALGVGGTTLLELTRAYAALPAGGLLPEPHLIRAVYGPDGRNLWPRPPGPKRVLDPATAYVLADMLRAVVETGTATRARALPFPVAGKTGTTDDQRDALFVGFSSRLAAGVWVGRDDNSPLGAGETGSQAALPAWIDLMMASAADGPPPPWPAPPAVLTARIDLLSGQRAGPACTETAYAVFVRGTEPAADCTREGFQWERMTDRVRLGTSGIPRPRGLPL